MAKNITVTDYSKARRLAEYITLESKPIAIARGGVVPNLLSFVQSIDSHMAQLTAGGRFEEFSEFDTEYRRLKQLSKLQSDAGKLLTEFRRIDQAELDAGREQLFESVISNG